MLNRFILCALVAVTALAFPVEIHAASYVVRHGDTLGGIAARYGTSVSALIRMNGIRNPNFVRIGTQLQIPSRAPSVVWYRVRPGDTLSSLGVRFGMSEGTLRSLNPSLGTYPLAGQLLRVCGNCGRTASTPAPSTTAGSSQGYYVVRPGDSLSGIAARFGVTTPALAAANGITNADLVRIGARLVIPAGATMAYAAPSVRGLIVQYANQNGIASSLALAVGWQESGFNQSVISATGAVGVMQVEPYTGVIINRLLGRALNLYSVQDNVQAGVFWLAHLSRYYAGNAQLAVAAYYQGTRSLQQHGLFDETVHYVNNVFALQPQFGG